MPHYLTSGFTVGFVFSADFAHVLLQLKARPKAHRGLYNGIGGARVPTETWIECMKRECYEECRLRVPLQSWKLLWPDTALDGQPLFIYTARYTGALADAQECSEGAVEWFRHDGLPTNVVADVPNIVRFARKKFFFP